MFSGDQNIIGLRRKELNFTSPLAVETSLPSTPPSPSVCLSVLSDWSDVSAIQPAIGFEQALVEKVMQVNKQNSELRERIEMLTREVDRLKRELAPLEYQNGSLLKRLEEMKHRKELLEDELQEERSQKESISKENKELSKLADLGQQKDEEISKLRTTVKELEEIISNLEASENTVQVQFVELEELRERNEILEAENADGKLLQAELTQMNTKLWNSYNEGDGKIVLLQTRVKELEEQYVEQEEKSSEGLSILKKEILDLRRHNGVLTEENHQLWREHKELHDAIDNQKQPPSTSDAATFTDSSQVTNSIARPKMSDSSTQTAPVVPPRPKLHYSQSMPSTQHKPDDDRNEKIYIHGHMGRGEAERALEKGKDGDFIIRKCETKLSDYTISLRCGSSVRHFLFRYSKGKLENNVSSFLSWKELISFYRSHPIFVSGCKSHFLKRPLQRPQALI